jgi:AraC-like DNA-binding protein
VPPVDRRAIWMSAHERAEGMDVASTGPRMSYAVLPLGPIDLGQAPLDRPVGTSAGAVSPACGAPLADPDQTRWRNPDRVPPTHPRHAVMCGSAGGGEPFATAEGSQPHRWLALARSIITELESSNHPVGELLRGRPRAYLVVVDGPAEPDYRCEAASPIEPWRPRPVHRAIKIMEADPAATFSMTDLARATNVSARTLQAAFRQHTGMSPMAYLRQLRLTRVHEDLLTADPRHHTVAGIAHRHGFPHLGRFAATYRARYGFNPSTALHLRPVSGQSDGFS